MSKIAITRKIVVTGKNTNAENVVKHDNPVISSALQLSRKYDCQI